jgi:hypothetical protein
MLAGTSPGVQLEKQLEINKLQLMKVRKGVKA